MDVVDVEGRISGSEVIADLCDRVAERLSKSCDLRQTDSYSSYSAMVTIQLELTDVDSTQVAADIVVGALDGQQPSERITLVVLPVAPDDAQERLGLESAPSLERTFDGSLPETHSGPPKTGKRYYTPRNSAPESRAAKRS